MAYSIVKTIKNLRYVKSRFLRRIIYRSLWLYTMIHFSYPVWWYILNHKSRKLYKKYQRELSALQKRIVYDLRKNGYAITHIDELFSDHTLFENLLAHMEKRCITAKTGNLKKFLHTCFGNESVTELENPFSKLSLDRAVLDIVNDYIGSCSKILTFELSVTIPVEQGAGIQSSQRWHRDPDDKIICKIFLYLNDVGETAGPFAYVSGSQYKGRNWHFFPQKLPMSSTPPLGVVEEQIPRKDIKVLTGTAGTIIFADTTGLHKGGYSTGGERIMFSTGYASSGSLWPSQYTCPESDTFKKQFAKLHPIAQHALQKN